MPELVIYHNESRWRINQKSTPFILFLLIAIYPKIYTGGITPFQKNQLKSWKKKIMELEDSVKNGPITTHRCKKIFHTTQYLNLTSSSLIINLEWIGLKFESFLCRFAPICLLWLALLAKLSHIAYFLRLCIDTNSYSTFACFVSMFGGLFSRISTPGLWPVYTNIYRFLLSTSRLAPVIVPSTINRAVVVSLVTSIRSLPRVGRLSVAIPAIITGSTLRSLCPVLRQNLGNYLIVYWGC